MFRRFRHSGPRSTAEAAEIDRASRPASSPGLHLGIAFIAVILTMAIVVGTALHRMAQMHHELEVIVQENNVKIELVNRMRAIVRDRMVAMNVMVLEEDPFKRDDIHLRYMALASNFIDARRRLEKMAASPKENEGLQKLRQLTLWATPFNESIVDSLLRDDLEKARMQLLDQALSAQLQVVAQIETLLGYYAKQAHQAEVRTHASYENASRLIAVLAGVALIMSLWISMKVVRRVARDRASLTDEIAERGRIEMELREARDNLESKVEERTAELMRNRDSLLLASKVFESSGEAIMIADAAGLIVDVNWAFSEITGFSREEAKGRAWQFLLSDRHDEAFRAALAETLRTTGMWHGEIWGSCKSGEVKPKWLTINAVAGGTGGIAHYVAIFRDISAIKDKEDRLWHLAHHDPLCGLPNRKLMLERLKESIARAERDEKRVALMLLDLDGFKKINDAFGHNVGDELLVHVARKLQDSIRIESDTVARLAGDEFVVIVGDIDSRSQAALVAEKILHHLEEPLGERQNTVIVANASIGIAIYPGDTTDPSALLKAADSAMYQAKARGKKSYCFYDAPVETPA